MPASIDEYLKKITSEHRDKPNFVAMISALVQPLADSRDNLAVVPVEYDVDTATDARLVIDGRWVGARDLPGMTETEFRFLILGKIINNRWDGSIPGLYDIFNKVFEGTGFQAFIVDHADLSMDIGLVGPIAIEDWQLDIFKQAIINVRPAGVLLNNYITPSVPGPIFALDLDNDTFKGLDEGVWAVFTPP